MNRNISTPYVNGSNLDKNIRNFGTPLRGNKAPDKKNIGAIVVLMMISKLLGSFWNAAMMLPKEVYKKDTSITTGMMANTLVIEKDLNPAIQKTASTSIACSAHTVALPSSRPAMIDSLGSGETNNSCRKPDRRSSTNSNPEDVDEDITVIANIPGVTKSTALPRPASRYTAPSPYPRLTKNNSGCIKELPIRTLSRRNLRTGRSQMK